MQKLGKYISQIRYKYLISIEGRFEIKFKKIWSSVIAFVVNTFSTIICQYSLGLKIISTNKYSTNGTGVSDYYTVSGNRFYVVLVY